jgi:hypothetical protein
MARRRGRRERRIIFTRSNGVTERSWTRAGRATSIVKRAPAQT